MNVISRFAICVATVMMIALVPVQLVLAADDNASVAQVYLEFDPATGEFKSVPATAQNSPDGSMVLHKSTAQSDSQTTAQDNTSAQAQTTAQTTPTADTSGTVQQGGSVPVIIGVIVALAVIGGIFAMTRKKAA